MKLINSSYAKNDAKEVLLSLLNDKIRFLSQRIFSLQERFGIDTRHEEARLEELKKARKGLLQILNSLDTEDRLVIDCDIRLRFLDRPTTEKKVVTHIQSLSL